MKEVALSEVKDDLSRYLRLAADEQIVITRHGKATGILIGFASEDDWFGYRLENAPRFLTRVAAAHASLKASGGIRLEDIEEVAAVGKPPPEKPKKRRRSMSRR